MTFLIYQGYILSILCFVGQMSIKTCPYLNLCNYNEKDNATLTEDDFQKIVCDCQKVTFCFEIELSEECNVTTIEFESDANYTVTNQLYCDVSSLETQTKIPAFEFLPQIGNETRLRIFTDSDYGKYKVFCSTFEIPDEFNSTINSEWEIVNVNPTSVLVDSEVELQLTIIRYGDIKLPGLWCFVSTPDNNTEILIMSWVSNILVNCTVFSPTVPGVFQVSLGSILGPNIFEKAVTVKVLSKHPVALEAKYSLDFNTIFVYFDENIEIYSTCADVFSRKSQEFLGVGFKCCIRGNTLVVKPGFHFKIIDDIQINFKNRIFRAGCLGTDFCLSAAPSSLVISKPKILEPNLNLYINSVCGYNSEEKYMSIEISPTLRANLTFENQIFQSFGKNQRKNLILWRILRRFQRKLFSRHFILQMNETDIFPLLDNIPLLENILDVDIDATVSTVNVIVTVKSSPSSSIMAQADVTFCESSLKLFRYKWFINKEDILQDGSVITVRNLAPGKYVVKCMVIAYNTADILGAGWTITEILSNEEKILIVPSEVNVGITDDIFLQALSWQGNSISWTCRTTFNEPCFTINKKLVSDMFDLNTLNISIPGGILGVGNYIWTAESVRGSNKAKVFINPGNISTISVKILSVFVKASEEFVLSGVVKKMERDYCLAWWTSVRQRGFSYFKLPMRESQKHLMEMQYPVEEVPLVIPPSENLNGLDLFYMFKFQVFCSPSSKNERGSLAYTTIPLVMRLPPRVSPVIVQPLEGKAMITNFMISGANVDVSNQNYLFLYEWSYVDSCDIATPIKRGAFSKNFTTYLPPGDLRIIVKVCDEKELCTTISSPVINVVQAFEFPAENFRHTLTQIQHLMGSSDVLEAFGLAVTVFKSLALLVESEVRQEAFSTVEETIKMKINDLTKKMSLNSNAAKSSLDFFERAVKVVKYFQKGSQIMNLLIDFKKNILKL